VTIVSLKQSIEQTTVYIVLGIDEHSHDQVLAVFNSYGDAKKFLASTTHETNYYDLWIEKHPVM
jgi:hypothetical protein